MGGSLDDKKSKHNPTLMPSFPQESPLSAEPESQAPFKASFSCLPLEIRQKIWLLTLQPRVLYLHIHQRIEPPHYDEEHGFVDGFRKTVSVNFTAQVATSTVPPSVAFNEYAGYVAPDPMTLDVGLDRDKSYLLYANILATRPWSIKNSRGPVALQVCSESRAVGMKRYELGFAGTNLAIEPADKEEWERKGFGEKRIWVDFKHDIIFVDAIWRAQKVFEVCAAQSAWFVEQVCTRGIKEDT